MGMKVRCTDIGFVLIEVGWIYEGMSGVACLFIET